MTEPDVRSGGRLHPPAATGHAAGGLAPPSVAAAPFDRERARRRALRATFWSALALPLVALLLVGGAFLRAPSPPRVVPAIPVADLPRLAPVHASLSPPATAWVVRLGDGQIIALSDLDPRSSQHVRWLDPAEVMRLFHRASYAPDTPEGIFRDGPTGSSYAIDGRRVSGPTPRDMGRYPVWVEDGMVFVDAGRLTPGHRYTGPNDHSTPTPAATLPGGASFTPTRR